MPNTRGATNKPGRTGQKGVVGAALCPTCHRFVLLAGSWQGKETPSAGCAATQPPPVADLTAVSEEPPKGMALLVWLQILAGIPFSYPSPPPAWGIPGGG